MDGPQSHYNEFKSQTHKAACCITPFMRNIQTGKSVETESKLVVARAGERAGECLLMGTKFLSGMMRKFWNEAKVVAAQHWECTKRL